jgi:PAS domain S-box-containing protein
MIENHNNLTELEQECIQLKIQLKQKNIELNIINELVHEISQELDLTKILNLVAEKAQQLIEADSLLIPIINKDNTRYTYMAATGKSASTVLNQTFPKKMGMCGWVLSNEEILFFGTGSTSLMGRESKWEKGMESALLVPLRSRGKIVGGLSGLGKKDGKSFTKQDQDILQLFADHISIAIENAFIFNELKLERDSVETTLKSIGDAVITTDHNGMVTRMNPIAEKLTGWKEIEALGLPLSEIFNIYNSDTRKPAENPVDIVVKSGEIVGLSNHTVLLAHDGHEYQIADSAAPIKDENDKINGVILVFRDVTEEYKLQEALTKNQKQLQAILDNTPAVIYIKDSYGHYQLVNKQFEKLFNISNEKIRDLTDYDIFSKNTADQYRAHDLNVLENKHYIEVEEISPHKDGPHSYISVKFPLFDSEGKAYAICGISTDITEHRKTEETLRRAQKMDAIGQLSGGIAHDFNNQLGVIIGYLDMLKPSFKNNELQSKWLTTASGATERCMDLTRQLLSFSSKKTRQTKNTKVNDCIIEMHTVISRSLTPQIEVNYQLTDDLWLASIDTGELQDALLNLILNAKDAMPAGGKLLIKTENVNLEDTNPNLPPGSKSNDYILITVEDNGIGMPPQTIERIFEPFYTTKQAGKGTGLGMAMVYGFTKRQEGFVKVYSEPNKGTKVKLYLPRSKTSKVTNINKNSNTEQPTGSETILIVDDETDLLHLAEFHLSSLGYKTYMAKDAHQALEILRQPNHIDLLFSDVVMPGGINGYELAKEAVALLPDLKVLMTSGFTSKNIQEAGLTKIACSMLNKPYRKEQLAQRIRETLDHLE